MEKMTGKSLDLVAENVEQLKRLFPEAVTEGKIDFEVLKNLLGGEIENRQEYYKFTWNGKEAARAYARVPSMGTLRPCVEESSGKDGTPGTFDSENLYIEGDNLEVLKLLQGAYHKKIKMIYIDPPYNTGKDFVYPDNYRDSLANYKSLTGQTNKEGVATRANPETSGRYHTDWLNMMYPRLILARNLLTDDGVMFISIDNSEIENLKLLCNDIFGFDNTEIYIWDTREAGTMPKTAKNTVRGDNEYIVAVFKSEKKLAKYTERKYQDKASEWTNPDNDPRGPWMSANISRGSEEASGGSKSFTITNPAGIEFTRDWSISQDEYNQLLQDNRIFFADNGKGVPRRKIFASDLIESIQSSIFENLKSATSAAQLLLELFGKKVFNYPKPHELISRLVQIGGDQNAFILDFFSGSASSAHAVMQLNAEDGGNRKFIMVQLPEVCAEETEAAKAGYKNICEIGKERIRRAAKKIKEENPLFAGDMGFKVFKLDTSNIIPWNPDPDNIELTMRNAVENMLAGRTRQDLLYEVLLKCNLPLTLPIEENKFGSNTVYIVGAGALAICLDQSIPQTIAEEIVKLRDKYAPIVPMQVVFRDNGFSDVAKTNALQILKQAGFEEKAVRTL